MDFDPVRSRLELRPFVGNARHCRRNQIKCATPRTSLRYCEEEDRFPEFGTGSNDFSRAHARVRATEGPSWASEYPKSRPDGHGDVRLFSRRRAGRGG